MGGSTDQSPINNGPRAAYLALLGGGELSPDSQQEKIVSHLQSLHEALAAEVATVGGGLFSRLFGNGGQKEVPRGLYIHGGVGRGKSMLMDLFFEGAPIARKRRVHFHEFMLECHGVIHEWRGLHPSERSEGDNGDDPITPLARKIADQARLLCFDEFQVSDVADAMILGRLFEALMGLGVVIVATSNRAPDTLYEGGLNRDLFLPFIDLIVERLDVLELDGPTDYRLQRMKGVQVYHVPVNDQTTQEMRSAFFAMTDRDVEDAHKVPTAEIEVQGRKLFVPKSSKGVAVFSFKRLCANPLGASDYLAIAWRYHTVFIVAIPRMGRDMRNEAKRFVTLIDTLYENNVKLICSAVVPPDQLYQEGDGSFEFSRTASRLAEMQSEEYLARGHAV